MELIQIEVQSEINCGGVMQERQPKTTQDLWRHVADFQY